MREGGEAKEGSRTACDRRGRPATRPRFVRYGEESSTLFFLSSIVTCTILAAYPGQEKKGTINHSSSTNLRIERMSEGFKTVHHLPI